MRVSHFLVYGLIAIFLTACASAPYFVRTGPGPVFLHEEQALLAMRVQFSSATYYVMIEGQNPGTTSFKLEKPTAKYSSRADANNESILEQYRRVKEQSLRVLLVPAGQYCVTRYGGKYRTYVFSETEKYCFDVRKGTLNYSGDIVEYSDGIRTQQNYKGYLTQLQAEYPELFSQFIQAE